MNGNALLAFRELEGKVVLLVTGPELFDLLDDFFVAQGVEHLIRFLPDGKAEFFFDSETSRAGVEKLLAQLDPDEVERAARADRSKL